MTMAQRGVTRFGMEHGHGNHDQEDQRGQQGGGGHDGGAGGMEMSQDDRWKMLEKHHRRTLWIWWMVLLLGFWLVATALSFDYARAPAEPSGGRGVWLPMDARASAMFWSDLVSGTLLILFGWRLLKAGRPRTKWAACFVGIWLQFAPLLFWCPSPLVYLNDTLVGVLVIALTVLIPGMPWMIMMMKMGGKSSPMPADVPPGWSYSPSSWAQRAPMIVLGFAGWLISRYLGAYQLGYLTSVWDPIFGEGTRRVLDSDLSHAWPVSDGGLGAISYTFEFLMAWMGSSSRWRTMPWMVLFFGVLVVPLGLTHVFLVSSMPVMVGYWCLLCLLAAIVMLPMIPLTLDEVVAMVQFMRKAVKDEGKPFWRTFWKGDIVEGCGRDERSPDIGAFPDHPIQVTTSAIWGVSVPWALGLVTAVGLWLMAAPDVLGTAKPLYTGIYFSGVLVVVTSVCAWAEVARAARYLNLPVGLWLLIAPFVLDGGGTGSMLNAIACGLLVIGLSLPRGKVLERYGNWERFIF